MASPSLLMCLRQLEHFSPAEDLVAQNGNKWNKGGNKLILFDLSIRSGVNKFLHKMHLPAVKSVSLKISSKSPKKSLWRDQNT